MSRTRRFLSGVGVSYVSQVTMTVTGLWLTPFLLDRLGSHDYGLWLTGAQLVAYLTLLDLGVLVLLPRDTAYATGRAGGQHHPEELADVIGRSGRLLAWQLPVIAGVAFVAWLMLPARWAGLSGPLALILTGFVLTYPLRLFQATLQGLQDLAFVGGMNFIGWAAGTVLTILLVLAGYGLSALAFGAVLTQVIALGGCGIRIRQHFSHLLPRGLPRLGWSALRDHLQRGLWVSASQLAQVMLYATDLLLVAWIFGPIAVVPYSCTQKLIAVLTNQPQVLTQAAAPALSELRTAATRDKLLTVTSALSLALMLGSGAVFVIVLAVNRTFVGWWVGQELFGGILLTAVMATAMVARHWNTSLVYALFAFGHERRLSLTLLGDGIVTVVLSLILVRFFGVVGVSIAFLCGALLVSLPANLLGLARETGASPWRFAAPLGPWALRLAPLAVLAVVAGGFLGTPRLVSVILAASVMGILYAAVMFPVALRPPLGPYVRGGLVPVLQRFGFAPAAATVPSQERHPLV